MKKRQRHDPQDISRGEERIPIPYINDHDNTELPEFLYSKKSEVFEKAHVARVLARIGSEDCCSKCTGDCLKRRIPCSCTRHTGGEYAYGQDGCLREAFIHRLAKMDIRDYCSPGLCPLVRMLDGEPQKCQGHLIRQFIKECHSKCRCNSMLCGNRVVQKGIRYKLQVFYCHEGKGWGLRALEDLPLGAFVCEYAGEILTNTELYWRNREREGKGPHTYPLLLDADWSSEKMLEDEDALCLDATEFGNVARFINHRCHDASLVDVPVEIETPDHHYYHVAFFTKRPIRAFEELTWDYGIDFDDEHHPIKAFECICGSTYCRGRANTSAGTCSGIISTISEDKSKEFIYIC